MDGVGDSTSRAQGRLQRARADMWSDLRSAMTPTRPILFAIGLELMLLALMGMGWRL